MPVTLATALAAAVALTVGVSGQQPAALRNPRDGAEFVLVPAGTFTMGATDGHGDERPPHKVTLDAFALYKFEVTNEQYQAFCKATGHRLPAVLQQARFNQPKQPVVGVSWEDAAAYCTWAGGRLPTEAEWEYAARGTDGRRYPWGNDRASPRRAQVDANNQSEGPKPVGSFPDSASPFGCMDMAGNAWEWVADWYAYDYYSRSPEMNPTGPEQGVRRVLRGGSWGFPSEARSSFRQYEKPDYLANWTGFRCAMKATGGALK
jgi:formylglycine-generating enzyme required for sulfatase activity